MVTIAEYLTNPVLIARKAQWMLSYKGPPREITLDTFNGRLTFDSRDKIIGRQLFLRRGFEADWIRCALKFLRERRMIGEPGGRMLDVGANIGMISIALLLQDEFEFATAFEPEPRNFELLRRNVAQNSLDDRMAALQLGLSSQSGSMQMELSTYNSGDHRIRFTAQQGALGEENRRTLGVPVETLDKLAARAPQYFDDVRLVWMDIQGHEGHFLEGAAAFLGSGIPLVSEFWPYGILRSGMSREEYLGLVGDSYSRAHIFENGTMQARSVAELGALFDALPGHTDMRQIILVRD